MTTPPVPDLKKASEITKSLLGHLRTNGPLLIALAIASVVAVSTSFGLAFEWQIGIRAVASFFISYLVLLWWFLGRPIRLAKHNMRRLGVEEKALLRTFLLQDKRTGHINTLYAPSASLVGKGILTYATSVVPVFNAPVVLQPYAWNYLRNHPELVGVKKDDIGLADYHDDSPWLTKP